MPTLQQLFSDWVTWAFFGLFFALWLLETLRPARPLPSAPGHRLRGLLAMLAFFLVSSYLPYLIGPVLEPLRIADLSGLGIWGGCLTMLVYQGLGYAYHRSMHGSDRLFRAMHQMHHSAERLDVPSAFLFAPLDMIGWTLVSTMALTVLGVSTEATIAFVLGGTFLSVFQHANLKTPRWLGYIVQRPESHSHHHGRGVHRDNYADLPVFDIVFGTFKNPASFAPHTGYYAGGSERVLEMVLLKDVTQPHDSRPAQRLSQRAEAAPILSGGQAD